MAVSMGTPTRMSGDRDISGVSSYTRTYRAKTTGAETEPDVLDWLAANGFDYEDEHPGDSNAVITKVSVEATNRIQDGAAVGKLWDITIEYGPRSPLGDYADPLDQPLRFRLEPIPVERPLFLDIEGNPIVNAAFDPFNPGVIDERYQWVLTVMRNEVTVDIPALVSLTTPPKVNNGIWNGFAAKTVKVLPCRIPERQWSQAQQTLYYPMEYVFHIDPEKWSRKLLNQGFNELYEDGMDTKRRAILDQYGAKVEEPWMLDEDGHALPLPIVPEDIIIMEFDIYEEIAFSVFGMDSIPF